ncbi:MAG: DUF4249 family protein [Saprospiraceae bacterium]|nr:DUF4249 family protein [Saprospiraceae bacterium]
MKKLLFLLPAAALFTYACSNDFEVSAPWKEIPAVYAILSPKDTAHYIRVEKAFLDPETSALQIAQIADSLYYPENAIQVYLERVITGKRLQMHRVDGNLEGYVRTGGIFATQPNWLYKFKPSPPEDSIFEGETYRFVLVRNDGRPDVTAETTVPSKLQIRNPSPISTPPSINFESGTSTDVTWNTDVNGVFFAVHFRIRYRDEYANGSIVRDTLFWTPVPNVKRSENSSGSFYKGTGSIPAESFYNFLVQNIPAANDRVRYFDGIDITVEGGGGEIERYLETATANSGLTGAEVIPTYTNLSEGFGLFTAKTTTRLNNIRVDEKTIKDINSKSPTKDLNFRFF